MGWYGVDLDGTLAIYDGRNHQVIGEPVPAMFERVQNWLRMGRDVKIFTARVAYDNDGEQKRLIEAWCLKHFGRALPVTATKDYGMLELWDDRCVTVEMNTGKVLTK